MWQSYACIHHKPKFPVTFSYSLIVQSPFLFPKLALPPSLHQTKPLPPYYHSNQSTHINLKISQGTALWFCISNTVLFPPPFKLYWGCFKSGVFLPGDLLRCCWCGPDQCLQHQLESQEPSWAVKIGSHSHVAAEMWFVSVPAQLTFLDGVRMVNNAVIEQLCWPRPEMWLSTALHWSIAAHTHLCIKSIYCQLQYVITCVLLTNFLCVWDWSNTLGSIFVSLGTVLMQMQIRRCVTADFNHGQSDQPLSFFCKTAVMSRIVNFSWRRSKQALSKPYTEGNWRTVQEIQACTRNIYSNNIEKEQCARNITDVVVLMNIIHLNLWVCIFTFQWFIKWPKLLCVIDSNVTHRGFAQLGRSLN